MGQVHAMYEIVQVRRSLCFQKYMVKLDVWNIDRMILVLWSQY